MQNFEQELEEAYLAGLDASLWWGKFSEFLYETNEGKQIRKELQADYLTWQKEELSRDPKQGLLTWQEMFRKLFPDEEQAKTKKTNLGEKRKKKEKKVSPHGIKKPKTVEKPRKTEISKKSATKSKNKVQEKPKKVKDLNKTETKPQKFKNI